MIMVFRMPALTIVAWIAIILGFVTPAIILADEIVHPQKMAIMNIIWPVTGLYFPLIGLWFYYTVGRSMAAGASPSRHEMPRWQSVFLSATHCGSGCVIGDIIGAPIVFAFGLTLVGKRLFAKYLVEFLIAYLLGIAFQYFAIKATRRISRGEAVKDAVKADTLALIALEVGLFAWMALVSYLLLPPPKGELDCLLVHDVDRDDPRVPHDLSGQFPADSLGHQGGHVIVGLILNLDPGDRAGVPTAPEELIGCEAVIYTGDRVDSDTWMFHKGNSARSVTLSGRLRVSAKACAALC